MSNVRLSLIGTSQGGREKEIFRLLESLVSVRDSVELVFVDQTRGDAISSVFDKFIGQVNFNLIKTDIILYKQKIYIMRGGITCQS